MSTVRRGQHYEAVAEAYLTERGWTVLDRNARFVRREIDLIVEKEGIVAFVEVKGRSGPAFGHPLEAITERKRRGIARAARLWMTRSATEARCYRFDAIAVVSDAAGGSEILHVEGAWTE